MRFYFEERLAVLVAAAALVSAALWRAERRCPRALLPPPADGRGGMVRVAVVGAVARPGERLVPRGISPRAAAAAAGATAAADLGAMESRVACAGGEVVYVPRRGEDMAAAERNREAALRRLRRPARPRPVDLNRASAEELAELPGVGEKLAAAIILERSRSPFRRLEDLRRVPGMGAARIERLRGEASAGGRVR
jgi:competence protein ComEA